MADLAQKRCLPCEGIGSTLDASSKQKYLKQLSTGWQISADNKLYKDFQFRNYYQTMAFVNAIAWMAHIENHHPDLEVSYNHCLVKYTTHALGGLTENDFICAQKIDRIMEAYEQKSKT